MSNYCRKNNGMPASYADSCFCADNVIDGIADILGVSVSVLSLSGVRLSGGVRISGAIAEGAPKK